MKREIRLALFVGLLLALAGCAPLNPGQMELAAVEVETVPTSIVSVSRADIFLENGRLVVTGSLRRMHELKMPGHVDIVVCGPAGLLERRSLPVPGLASKRGGARDLPFTASFELLPPPGAKVVVRYHGTFSDDEKVPGCA